MIAAVLAVLASTQLPAVTLTVRQQETAGRPVAGLMMWCTRWPATAQVRTVVLEVASPPERIVTVCPGASGPAAWSSVTRTPQPPPRPSPRSAGGGPATAMSPPRLTSTPDSVAAAIRLAQRSAAQALAVAPRSSWAPLVSCTSPRLRSSRTLRQPGTPRVTGAEQRRARARRLEHREVAVIADLLQRLPAGRVHVAVGEPRGAQRRLDELGEQAR